jgi:hypothetical protein
MFYINLIYIEKILCWEGKLVKYENRIITLECDSKERYPINCTPQLLKKYNLSKEDLNKRIRICIETFMDEDKPLTLVEPDKLTPDYSMHPFIFAKKFNSLASDNASNLYFNNFFLGKQLILIGNVRIIDEKRQLILYDRFGFGLIFIWYFIIIV